MNYSVVCLEHASPETSVKRRYFADDLLQRAV